MASTPLTRKDGGKPPRTITLVVTVDLDTGQRTITGPLHDDILCYGLLEAGKKLVAEAQAQAAKKAPLITVPRLQG